MTQTEQVLLSLIKNSLFGICEAVPSDTAWDAVLSEARQQAVLGLTTGALPKDLPQNVSVEWKMAEYQQLAQQIRYWDAQDRLHRLLTDSGISYVILKGASAAMLYPSPIRRSMGDIDFLVLPEQFEQAKELLLANGYERDDEPEDRHLGFSKEGISYELHRRFSYLDLDMEDVLQDGLSRAELQTVDGHAFYSLPAAENGLVLLGHLWNHLHTGVGLRQVIDWMLYVHQCLDDEMWNNGFSALAERYGLMKLAVHAAHMCQMYLGLTDSRSWYAKADEELCGELLLKVFQDGNFGIKNSPINLESRKTMDALTGIHRYGLFKHLQTRGEANWMLYQRHHWLKPFAWVYQLLRYPLFWFKSENKKNLPALIKGESETQKLLRKLS